MGRLLGIDYGLKRVGIAVTDPLKIIASPLETVPTEQIMTFLNNYLQSESVELFILGWPTREDGSDTDSTPAIREFKARLRKKFPNIPVELVDERNTSKEASLGMVSAGFKKKDRRNKANVDKIAASLILQTYLEGNLR